MSASPYALRPSAAPRWVECPGSVRMEAQYPGEESEASREGTAAHWVAAAMLRGEGASGAGTTDPDGTVITEEMIEAAGVYVEAVEEAMAGVDSIDSRGSEDSVACREVHSECGGTPDLWFWSVSSGRVGSLTVMDFKFGHRFVDAFENWQLITYVSGVLDRLGVGDVQVNLGIVQPRNYAPGGPVRWWRTTAAQLRPYIERLRAAAEAAMAPEADCKTGAHCRDCSARAHCPANQAAGMSWLDESRRAIPHELTPEVVGRELALVRRAIAELQARETGLEAFGLAMIRDGKNLPGFQAEQGQGRERWNRPDSEVTALAGLYGVDVLKFGLITPKQAIKAGLPAEVVRAYTETPPGALKLVPCNLRGPFSN